MQKHADKIGIVGSTFAALCCLGFPAVLSIVAAIGLGFLINDAILAPLLLLFILLTLWGLAAGRRRHGQPWALGVGVVAGVLLFVSAFLFASGVLTAVSVASFIAASVLNITLARPER